MCNWILKKIIIEFWYLIKAYFTTYILPDLKEALEKTKEYFINSFWDKIKEDINLCLNQAIVDTEKFFSSESYETKEDIIIENLYNKINPPIALKPFKFLIKGAIKKRIRELISDKLTQLKKMDKII